MTARISGRVIPFLLGLRLLAPFLPTPDLRAQDEAPAAGAFEVASVKKSLSTRGGAIYHMPAGRFKAESMTLLYLISFAYDIADDQIQGLPSWASRERFDIEAIAEAPVELNPAQMETPAKKAMVRRLLSERFALATRIEQRTVQTYSLVEMPSGHKLEPASAKPYLIHAGRRSYVFQKATVAALAKQLSQGVRADIGRPVVDKTGISGEFDFSLAWASEKPAALPPPDSALPVAEARDLPSIFEALRRLGLELKSDHAVMPLLRVMKVEPPTPN